MYIPSNKAEIRDRVSAMVLCMPDMRLPNSDLDFDGAYSQLEYSLGLIRDKLGDARHDALIDMARRSKQHFIDDQGKEGRSLLQAIRKRL